MKVFVKNYLVRTSICSAIAASLLVGLTPQAQAETGEANIYQADLEAEAAVNADIDTGTQGATVDQIFVESQVEKKPAHDIEEKVTKQWGSLQSKVAKEFSKLKICTSVKLFDGIAENLHFSGDAKYEYCVEPAFRDGDQLRKDVWLINLNTFGSRLFAGGQLRVTFIRTFSGEGAKWKAMKALPYTILKIPKNSNDIKTKYNNGDSVRVEILGRLGVADGRGKNANHMNLSFGGGYSREALFMVDLYKFSETITRARFIGLKNQGTYNFSMGVETEKLGISFLPSILKDLFSVGGGIGFSKTDDLFVGKYPIDTLMIDYLYKFSSDQPYAVAPAKTAEEALDEVLKNSRSFGFGVLFKPTAKKDEVSDGLLSKAALSEKYNREDRDAVNERLLKPSDMRVRTLFKGRIRSNVLSTTVRGNVSLLGRMSNESGLMKSHVTSFDHNDKKSYFLFDNAFGIGRYRALYHYIESNYIHDIDLLVTSNEKEEPIDITDIVVKTTAEDKSFSKSRFDDLKDTLKTSLPRTLLADKKIDNFFPTTGQSNATLSYQYNFGINAFKSVFNLDADNLRERLDKFLWNHPDKYKMGLPATTTENGENYFDYIQKMAAKLAIMLNEKSSTSERLSMFREMKGDLVFQRYILGEFFASMIPAEIAQKEMGLRLTMTSNETPSKIEQLGELSATPIYQAVAFLRSVINDRSFDLRMGTRIDTEGNEIIDPIQFVNQPVQATPPAQK